MVLKFSKMGSPKAVYILFQTLIALIVSEFFPIVWNEGLNNLPVDEAAVL